MIKKVFFILLLNISFFSRADFGYRPAPKPEIPNIFYDLPVLETERLVLRKVQEIDAQDLFVMYSDLEVVKYIASEQDQTIEDTKKWIEWRLNKYKNGIPTPWAMVLKQTGHVIGLVGFCDWQPQHGMAELMLLVTRAHWNLGCAQEALHEVLHYGFETMGLNRIGIFIHPDNKIAIHLFEKFGFVPIGFIPECFYYRGAYWPRIVLYLLKDDFMQIATQMHRH